jgi:hypothetical protein
VLTALKQEQPKSSVSTSFPGLLSASEALLADQPPKPSHLKASSGTKSSPPIYGFGPFSASDSKNTKDAFIPNTPSFR